MAIHLTVLTFSKMYTYLFIKETKLCGSILIKNDERLLYVGYNAWKSLFFSSYVKLAKGCIPVTRFSYVRKS